jgi:hypothetical protein
MAEKTILATLTGEPFQPVRLHYNMFNQKALLRAFQKLRCLDRDPTRQRWVWLYDFEARNLLFQQSYAQIPRRHHPIVIGTFVLRSNGKLVLDLRSCERAVLAIPFFDRHIPRRAAQVTEAEVVNRLFPGEDSKLSPEQIFDRQETVACDPNASSRAIAELTANVQDPQEKIRIASEYTDARTKQPLPEIERFPFYFYEEGIQAFKLTLKMRQLVAYQHWLGNTGYSMYDLIQEMVQKMSSDSPT